MTAKSITITAKTMKLYVRLSKAILVDDENIYLAYFEPENVQD